MRFLNRWQISVIKEQEGGPRWCVSSRLCQQQGGWTEKISDSREKPEELHSVGNSLENNGPFVESKALTP